MRVLVTRLALLTLLALAPSLPAARPPVRVLMMIPDDFMWPEYQIPHDLYRGAGFQVTLAGKYPGEVRPDRRNARDYPASRPLEVDLTFDQVDAGDYDAVTFVAGNGAWHDFFPNQTVHRIVKATHDQGRILGLLCASTGLLGFVDNVEGDGTPLAAGRRAVGYYRVEGILRHLGRVRLVDGGHREPAVVVDGNLVTGRNPESSALFGKKIVGMLARRGRSTTPPIHR